MDSYKSDEKTPKILDFSLIFEVLALVQLFHHLPEDSVKQLIAFLLDHAMLDFSGGLTIEMVKEFLRDDETPEGKALMAKLMQDGGVDEMQVTLADCLQEQLRTGLNENAVAEQLKMYAES